MNDYADRLSKVVTLASTLQQEYSKKIPHPSIETQHNAYLANLNNIQLDPDYINAKKALERINEIIKASDLGSQSDDEKISRNIHLKNSQKLFKISLGRVQKKINYKEQLEGHYISQREELSLLEDKLSTLTQEIKKINEFSQQNMKKNIPLSYQLYYNQLQASQAVLQGIEKISVKPNRNENTDDKIKLAHDALEMAELYLDSYHSAQQQMVDKLTQQIDINSEIILDLQTFLSHTDYSANVLSEEALITLEDKAEYFRDSNNTQRNL